MEYIRRHLTVASIVIDNFTNGYIRLVFHTHRQLYHELNPSVFDSTCHND